MFRRILKCYFLLFPVCAVYAGEIGHWDGVWRIARKDINQCSLGLWQQLTYDAFGRPVATTLGTQPLRTCYYDDYAFLSGESAETQSHLQYVAMSAYGTRYTDTHGLLTGELVYRLDGSGYDIRTYYYDERGRAVQTRSTNHLGGYESEYFKYAFTGEVLQRRHEHSAAGKTPVTEVYDYTYDHAGRLLTTTHTFNGGTPVTLVANQYDAVGRLSSTTQMGASALTTAYTYNVRSWPKTVSNALFSETLCYEDGSHPRWGGSISSQEWNADGTRRYDYAYDSLSRLLRADYSEAGGQNTGRYSTAYSYDRQGNLTEIMRHGLRGMQTGVIQDPVIMGMQAALPSAGDTPIYGILDSLACTYQGNRLLAVENHAPGLSALMSPRYSFVDGAHADVEYAYDDNGNLTQDLNKGLTAVSYNTLSLPERYVFATGDTTFCTYDAAGEKLQVRYSTQTLRPISISSTGSIVSPQGGGQGGLVPGDPIQVPTYETTAYDYCGSLVYQNGVLKRILVDGGYISIKKTGTGSNATYAPTYHAYLRDHLGSNRVVASASGTAEEVYHYYPYGSMFDGGKMFGTVTTPSQPYLYCSKELDTMHGLVWYDSKARTYDPVLGMFPQMDPLAEKTPGVSSYAYCGGNPISKVDPSGRFFGDYIASDGSLIGSDNIDDGRLYVLKTYKKTFDSYENAPVAGISKREAKRVVKERDISNKGNFVEITGSQETREKVVSMIKDDGAGGTSANNNREYLMTFPFGGNDPNLVYCREGKIGNPDENNTVFVMVGCSPEITYVHTHPSGETTSGRWRQAPSAQDVLNANGIGISSYVIGMKDQVVYIYDQKGIRATLPLSVYRDYKVTK